MIKKTSKIYIAGHTGLVGSALTRNLQKHGYNNLVFRTIEELNLMDYNAVEAFFMSEKPEYVILAAAKVGGIIANNVYRADFIYQNIQIQNNVIFHCHKYGVKKLVFLGSSCIYPKNAPQPLKEDSLLTSDLEYTNEPYAIAKIAGIKMCESFNLQYGTNFISVMPTNLFGPNDNFDLEKSHVLPAVIRKLHLGKCLENNDMNAIRNDLNKFPIEGIDGKAEEKDILGKLSKYGVKKQNENVSVEFWGTGKPKREFLHSDDLADAVIYIFENLNFEDLVEDKSLFSQEVKNIKNTHINIGRGTDITIKNLVEMISKIVGYSGKIEWDSSKPDGTSQKLMDVSKLNKLGWKEKLGLEEGIRLVYGEYCGE
ncbi:MAG: GDP-L-fucose synthase [Bacteroidales bacterium]|nr:GDP-L-fucose synthase [Bacteroidales bacterium]MCF8390642.1 GDP-L-fucose synthase [Bacteroidales bacterium]